MKKYLIIIALVLVLPLQTEAGFFDWLKGLFGKAPITLGAPSQTFQRSLIPIDSTENLGTSTAPWDELHVNEICLSADCKDAWPVGGGGSGGGTWSTTTSQTSGVFINYPNNNDDVVAIGSNASTTAEFFFDPNTTFAKLGADVLITGSTTLQNFTGINATTTNATTTNLYVSGATRLASINGILKGTTGVVGTAANGTDYTLITDTTCSGSDKVSAIAANGTVTCSADETGAGGGGANSKWATTSDYINPNVAGTGILVNSGTSTITNLQVVNGTTTNATSTNLNVSGTVDFDGLTSALILTGATGILDEYAGSATCTNQAVTVISALGAVTCASINGDWWSGTDLSVANGGTGASTFTDHGVLVGSGTDPFTALSVGTNGQILVGSTGADPTFATLNCADGLTCTTGAGTLEIDFDGGDSPSGDLGGTWASPSVTDDSHAHTGASLSGIDIGDDTNLAAGRSLTLTGDTVDVDVELYTLVKTINVSAGGYITATTTISQIEFPLAVTITRISCSTDTGTATIQLDERAEATPNTGGTDVMTAQLVCDNDSQVTTAFDNAGIASRVPVNLDIDSVASSPRRLRVHVEYTIND